MNKRLVCLTLSILMLLTCVFASCTPQTKDPAAEGETVDNSAKTITMWVVTEDETTDKAKEAVNEAFAKITKAKFKTNVVIQFCTEDEYYEKLEGAIKAAQDLIELEARCAKELRQYIKAHKGEGKDNATLTAEFYAAHPEYQQFQKAEEEEEDEDAPETEEETEINEFGIAEIKYPDPKENQVDIFYLSGYDKYMEYYEKEYLSSLSEELSTSSKKLTTYISSSLLNGVQIEGAVYAIPNNVEIGEYTYMMIDKALFDMYYQKIDNVQSVLDVATFLNDVKNYNEVQGKTAEDAGYVVPLAATFEQCAKMLCWYWDLSYVDQSVYEYKYDETKDRTYVLKKEIERVELEYDDEGNEVEKTTKVITGYATPDVLYKTNAQGQFVDAEGNVLHYSYRTDNEGGYIYNEKKDTVGGYDAAAAGSLYLVDENGDAVREDKRVIIEGETRLDADGVTRPTYYYSYNTDADFSILGTMMKDASLRSRGKINLGFNSLFTDAEYREMYATLKNYTYQEFYGEVKDGQTAAVSFVKGDARIKLEYEKNGIYTDETGKEYYVVVAEYPEATEEELYGNMYAVYSNSNYLARSMEVITYLNTNKELRDLLQYGIKDQHYQVIEDKATEKTTARLLSNEKYGIYRMDIEKTGNCFIATPPESMGVDAWLYAKSQNNDSLVNPLMGFDFNAMTADSDYSLDVALIDHIAELNAEALDLISECSDKSSLMDLMSDTTDGLHYMFSASAGDTKLNKATNPEYDPEMPLGENVAADEQTTDTSGSSPYTVYQTWLSTYGYLVEDESED